MEACTCNNGNGNPNTGCDLGLRGGVDGLGDGQSCLWWSQASASAATSAPPRAGTNPLTGNPPNSARSASASGTATRRCRRRCRARVDAQHRRRRGLRRGLVPLQPVARARPRARRRRVRRRGRRAWVSGPRRRIGVLQHVDRRQGRPRLGGAAADAGGACGRSGWQERTSRWRGACATTTAAVLVPPLPGERAAHRSLLPEDAAEVRPQPAGAQVDERLAVVPDEGQGRLRRRQHHFPAGSEWARNPIPRIWDSKVGLHNPDACPGPSTREAGSPPGCLAFPAPCPWDTYTTRGLQNCSAGPDPGPMGRCDGDGASECASDKTDVLISDYVYVPDDLPAGEYVLGWRWRWRGDGAGVAELRGRVGRARRPESRAE